MLKEKADVTNIRRYIEGIHFARLYLASVVMPGAFSDEVLKTAKEKAVRFSMGDNDERYQE